MNKCTSNRSVFTALLIMATAIAAAPAADNGPGPITIQSLFHNMTNRDRLASWPKVEYRCSPFTSYDRASCAGQAGVVRKSRLRLLCADRNKRQPAGVVLMDADGPGAVVFLHNAAEYRGTIRIYFDHNPKPAIEAHTEDLIGGKFLAEKPFSYNLAGDPLVRQSAVAGSKPLVPTAVRHTLQDHVGWQPPRDVLLQRSLPDVCPGHQD